MTKAYITEFIGINDGSPVTQGAVTQTVTYTTSSVQSSAFGARTTLVRIHVDGISSVAIGKNPTATTNSMRMAAGQTEYFAVSAGDKAAFINNT